MTADSFRLLYSALDGNGTVQLWATDGTPAGTAELTAVANDGGGLFPGAITVFNGQAAFTGIDAAGRTSLWITNGSAAGTAELAPADAFINGLDPKGLIAVGDHLLFTGTDATGHTGLWTTDGTAAGTHELLAIPDLGPAIDTPETALAGGRAYVAVNGRLLVSDGTAGGTTLLATALPTADPPTLAPIGDALLFTANGHLWRTDGTPAGTTPLAPLDAYDLTPVHGGVLFSAIDAHGNAQLWFTDGAAPHALTAFTHATPPFDITPLAGSTLFFTDGGGTGTQLWSTDGITVTPLTTLPAPGLAPAFITPIGATALFTTTTGGLWTTDGTPAGTTAITGPAFAGPGVALGATALLATSGPDAALYATDGTPDGTTRLIDAPYAGGLTLLPPTAELTTNAAPACFLPGTLILTEHGPVAIEHLRPGDRVFTVFGGLRPLLWIGAGRATIGARKDHPARPVLIRAGALGPNTPARDLRLTQGHCLHFPDGTGPGALVPAALLVNGTSILLDPGEGDIVYHHLAVDGHDAVLAEGAACETWHNDGTAWQFDLLPPAQAGLTPCAPKLAYGPATIALWRTLRTRAGCPPPGGTPDPALHLLADDVPISPDFARDGRYRFTLRHRPSALYLASRSAIPAITGLAPDLRRLGVGLRGLAIAQRGTLARHGPESPVYADGFHPPDPTERLRWTAGLARFDPSYLRLARAPLRLELMAETLAAYPP